MMNYSIEHESGIKPLSNREKLIVIIVLIAVVAIFIRGVKSLVPKNPFTIESGVSKSVQKGTGKAIAALTLEEISALLKH